MSFLTALATSLLAKLGELFLKYVEKRKRQAALNRAIDYKAKREAEGIVDAKTEDELEKAARDILSRS